MLQDWILTPFHLPPAFPYVKLARLQADVLAEAVSTADQAGYQETAIIDPGRVTDHTVSTAETAGAGDQAAGAGDQAAEIIDPGRVTDSTVSTAAKLGLG